MANLLNGRQFHRVGNETKSRAQRHTKRQQNNHISPYVHSFSESLSLISGGTETSMLSFSFST